MKPFKACRVIALLTFAFCLAGRVGAAPAKSPSKVAVFAAEYRCLGAFQPGGSHSLGETEDVWQDAQGRLSTLSMSYVQSYAPDGSFLMACRLTDPQDRWFGAFNHVITDKAGKFYGVDSSRCQIVVFGQDGKMIRLFGTKGDGDGELYVPEDAAINPQGHLVVADMFNHRLTVWTTEGRWLRNIPLAPPIAEPQRLRIDSRGHIFVLDRGLYELDPQGGFLRTLVPPAHKLGDSGLYGPLALALGVDGCIYVAEYDPLGGRILKVDPNGHILTSIGVQNGVTFDRISGIWVDTRGCVYAADSVNRRILVFAPKPRIPSEVQTSLSPLVPVMIPSRVSKPEYVFDRSFGGTQGTLGWVLFPKDVALGIDGSVYVSGRGAVTRFTSDGAYLKSYAEPRATAALPPRIRHAKLIEPIESARNTSDRGDIRAITLDRSGNLFAAYSLKPALVCWKADGSPPVVVTLPKRGEYTPAPHTIATDSHNRLYIPEDFRSEIPRYDENGQFLEMFGSPGRQEGQSGEIAGLTIDRQDNVFVTYHGGNVSKIDPNGKTLWTIGGTGLEFGKFRGADAIATDSEDNVFVADYGNGRIQKFGPDGTFLTSFGELDMNPEANTDTEKMLRSPTGLAVGADGRVYVADMSRVIAFRPLTSPAKTP